MKRLPSNHETDRTISVYSPFKIENFLPGIDIFLIFIAIMIMHLIGTLPIQSGYPIPNPFWAVIILSAAQYGFGPGLVTVVAATAFGWMTDSQAGDIQSDYYAYLLERLCEPILWLLTVGILGGIRQRQADATEELQEEVDRRQDQSAALAEQCSVLRQEVIKLEHAIAVTGAGNAGLLLELLNDLVTAPTHRLEEVFRDTLAQLIGAEGIEFVLFEDLRSRPHPEGNISVLRPFPLRLQGVSPPLIDALLSSGRPLSCAREYDAACLVDAALAAPIPGSAGEVLGAVFIKEADPDCLCATGEAALSLSCFILGRRITQARESAADAAPTGLPAQIQLLQTGGAIGSAEN